jgi:positive regulator of sigma E activity
MIESGQIISVEGRYAIIELEARGGCAQCGMNHFCHSTGSDMREMRVLKNDITCRPGDTVEIEIPARGLVSASFLIFILPLLLAFGAYALVYYRTDNTGWGVAAFLSCFVLTMGLIAWVNKWISKAVSVQPRIMRKL